MPQRTIYRPATTRTVLPPGPQHNARMLSEFESVKNLHEAAVFQMVQALAGNYPSIGGDAELLADVACVALNRVPPRYIRHLVDLRFYQDNNERVRVETAVKAAVVYAFQFVQSRQSNRVEPQA
jgi:Late competence development protein ComFB